MSACNCPTPPGGVVVCPPDHAAACLVDQDGNLFATCIPITAGLRSAMYYEDTGRLTRALASQLAMAFGFPPEILERARWQFASGSESFMADIAYRAEGQAPIPWPRPRLRPEFGTGKVLPQPSLSPGRDFRISVRFEAMPGDEETSWGASTPREFPARR